MIRLRSLLFNLGYFGLTGLLGNEAVGQLDELHGWAPSANAEETLRESLDHGGFTSHLALVAEIDNLAVLNRDEIIPRPLIEGLMHIAERAPALAREEVPVHADIPHQDVIFLDETDPISSPMKAKGIGELGLCGVAAAIANAVYNATGVRIRNYPVTLDKLINRMPDAV